MAQATSPLTIRWTPLKPHPVQLAYANSPSRFNVVPSGRRSGKSERAKRKLVTRALLGSAYGVGRFFAAAPTREQAKRIFWTDLKALVPGYLLQETRESELVLKIAEVSEIYVIGMDKPERIEGQPWDGGVLDESANMHAKTWPEHVRPALADRLGWCDLIGVPEGRNHYYDLYKYARDSGDPEWSAFSWKSADILPRSEIEAARRELDSRTYQQEFEASFETYEGRAYYNFQANTHCSRLLYDPRAPLSVCFDFNINPGIAVICQEQQLPNGQFGIGVIGEVYIPQGSNTKVVCDRIIEVWSEHQGLVFGYGDAAGGAGGSAKISGSDWEIIDRMMTGCFGGRWGTRVPNENPRERVRVNAVNSMLLSIDGDIRLMVDPVAAPNVVTDFEGTRTLVGGSGQIDKRRDPNLSHLCFAGNTEVETPEGIVAIKDLPPTGLIRGCNGEFVEYTDAGQTQTAAPTVSVMLSNGESVVCTPDHLWLTNIGWCFARDLKGKTLVRYQDRPQPSGQDYAFNKIAFSTSYIGRPTQVSGVIADFIQPTYCLKVETWGCFSLADGFIVSNSDSIGYYVCSREGLYGVFQEQIRGR